MKKSESLKCPQLETALKDSKRETKDMFQFIYCTEEMAILSPDVRSKFLTWK